MDLWQAFARLGKRPVWLATVVGLAVALGVFGWFGTSTSYSVTSSQALRLAEQSGSNATLPSGSFELGVIGSMIAQNLNTMSAGPAGSVTATNAVVNPPTALPLITMSVTSETAEGATATLKAAEATNAQFLEKVVGSASGRAVELVSVVEQAAPQASSQPRIRAGGAGFVLGLMGGLLVLLVADTLARRLTRSGGPARHA